MTDKVCDCQFCKDHQHLLAILPSIPEEHREFVTRGWENFWQADEELGYKKAILDGSWPQSVEILEHHLANAKAKAAQQLHATPEQVAAAESDIVEPDDVPDLPVTEEAELASDGELIEEDPWHCGSEHQGDFF